MRAILYLILLIILTTTSLHAQKKKSVKKQVQHQLLWEISGNGLTKPSYLYGTMHVQDRRAFEFSDSVLVKFQGCTAFAAEVLLDTAMRHLLTQLMGDGEEEEEEEIAIDEFVQDTSGEEEAWGAPGTVDSSRSWKEYVDAEVMVAEPAPPTDLSSGDTSESFSSTDSPITFSDTEVAPAEFGSAESDEEESDSESDEVDEDASYGKYERFDIDFGSERSFDLNDNPLFSDLFSGRRAPRVTDKPVFLDAYLTSLAYREGKEVIGLETIDEQLEAAKSLRSMIFKMFSSSRRRKAASGLDPDDLIVYYRSGDLEKISLLMNEVLSPEAYSVMIVQRNYRMAERAERHMKKGPTFIAIGAGHLPGKQGVIQLLRDRGFTVRPVAATFTGLADSYKIPPRDSTWSGFTSEEGAFSAEMPMEPIELGLIDDDRADVVMTGSTYMWPDILTGIRFIISYGDFGRVRITNADSSLKQVYDTRVANVLRTFGQPVSINVDGMPGLEFLTKETDGAFRRTRLILRRNRLYTLSVEGTREVTHSPDAEQFFNAFRINALTNTTWRSDTLKWGQFVVETPGRIKKEWGPRFDFADEVVNYTYRDNFFGMSYSTDVVRLSKYAQYPSVDSLLRLRPQFLTGVTGVENERMVERNGLNGFEYDVRRYGSVWRTRRVLFGNRLYELHMEVPEEMIDSPSVGRFFDSFRPLGEPTAIDLTSDKSEIILDDLTSSDTAVAGSARRAAEGYAFTARHLPRIYNLLGRSLNDDESDERTIKAALYDHLGMLRDPAAVAFIRGHYDQIERNAGTQYAALDALREIGTDEALTTMAELMVRDTASEEGRNFSSILYRMESTSGAKLFPTILGLMRSAQNRESLYYLTGRVLDSNKMARDVIAPYADQIVDDCAHALRVYQRENSEYDEDDEYAEASGEDDESEYDEEEDENAFSKLVSSARLLSYLPYSPRIDNLLRGMMRSSNSSVVMTGAEVYLRHGGTPPKSVLNMLAEDVVWFRTGLYEVLESVGRVELYPEEHLSQRGFAESILTQYFSNDDSYYDSLEFVAQRVVTSGERPGRIYLFKVKFGELWTAAISGTQPLDEEKVSVSRDMVYTDYTPFEKRTVDEHFDVLMKMSEEGEVK